jgi:hydroxymethylglutaryl-CoA synthase
MTAFGIHDLAVATAHHVVDLADLAHDAGVDPAKYRVGLGQDRMSVPSADEDVVTMGAAAALPVIERNGADGIRTLLFATESGVDQSKSAGLFAHRLLGLSPRMRVIELKQACYGATGALQAAIGMVARRPAERVLVIASDVARYELGSAGEPTQGAGAVAMLVSADPALVEIEPASGLSAADVDDFWRPNDSSTAVVDGALSMSAYLHALTAAWDDFRAADGCGIGGIDRFAFHQPFTKMARKALQRLARHTGAELDDVMQEATFAYNRELGNTYTASLYAGLAALLDHEDGLADRRIGFFSYGSGAVGEFFTGIVRPGYERLSRRAGVQEQLAAREPISLGEYRALHAAHRAGSADLMTPSVTRAPFRFAGVRDRARRYEPTG